MLVDHAALPECLDTPLARVPVTVDTVDLILPQDCAELLDNGLRRERRTPFPDHVEHAGLALLVTDRQRERVARATGWVNEARIPMHAIDRPLANARLDTSLHRLAGDEALNIEAELGKIFSGSKGRVPCKFCIDFALRIRRVELPCGALRHQHRLVVDAEV